jgi:hypothetical protein
MSDRVKARELPTRTDTTDGTVIYDGFVNGSVNAPKFAIRKTTLDGTTWITSWADGTRYKEFNWADRATLVYVENPQYENYQA